MGGSLPTHRLSLFVTARIPAMHCQQCSQFTPLRVLTWQARTPMQLALAQGNHILESIFQDGAVQVDLTPKRGMCAAPWSC